MPRPMTLAFLALLLSAGASSEPTADPYAVARAEFRAAYAAAAAIPAAAEVPADSEALQRYPLYPYLLAPRLQRRLEDPAAAAGIEAFLAEHGAAPFARSLRRSWLMALAQRKAWEPYLAAYREE